jgi:hypothetical protein
MLYYRVFLCVFAYSFFASLRDASFSRKGAKFAKAQSLCYTIGFFFASWRILSLRLGVKFSCFTQRRKVCKAQSLCYTIRFFFASWRISFFASWRENIKP